jgi:hypothetical protein
MLEMTHFATQLQTTQWLVASLVAEYGATTLHHVYGGIVYRTPERLAIAAFFTLALVVTMFALVRSLRQQSPQFVSGLVIGLVWVVMLGFFEGGYNHAYKDTLFIIGMPKETVLGLMPVLMAGDFTYPPDNSAFEVSGVLQFVFSLPTAYFLYRFIRDQIGSRQENSTVHATKTR